MIDDPSRVLEHEEGILMPSQGIRLPLMIVMCGSVLDAVLTYHGHELGVLQEANPLWVDILSTDPMAFFALKVVMTTLCCLMLAFASVRRPAMSIAFSWLGATAYLLVIAWHVVGLLHTAV